MSDVTTTNFRVQIKDIEVDDEYFRFTFRVLIEDRVHKDWEIYEDDHSWGNQTKEFKKTLMTGHALQLVIDQLQIIKD